MKATTAIDEALAKAEREGRVSRPVELLRSPAELADALKLVAPKTAKLRKPKINLPVERLAYLFRHFGEPEREYRFHARRKWRFDLAFPAYRLAVEYEGLFAAKSRHTTVKGFDADAEKYSVAAISGWVVVRITPIMLRDGRAEDLAERAGECVFKA